VKGNSLCFSAEIRKIIYTTNAVESLNMSLRKSLKTRRAFPSEEAALKGVCLPRAMTRK
jgi:putative transposase